MVVSVLAATASAWGVLMGLSPVLQIRRMLRQRSSREVSLGYTLPPGLTHMLGSRTRSARLELSGRNLLTRGVDLNALVGKRFRVGALECRGIELCEPCATMESRTACCHFSVFANR